MHGSKLFKLLSALMLTVSLFSSFSFGNADASIANGPKFLGNVIANSVPSNFATYWNQVTPENSTKWGSVESTRNSMNWSGADTAYNYAKSNGFPFKFHTLVWGSQEPGWVSGLSAADQKAEVTQWIQAAGARYGGAEFVDVVNEPLHAKPSYRNAIGGDGSTGWDWVIWSFQQARQAFPNSKLLINEYGIISDPNATAQYVNIINLLKSRGLVDGIGIQCHYFNMDNVSVSTMTSVLNTLAATGLPIYVSELDMTGDDSTQLARYQQKFPVLWEHSAVKGITLWGYIEGQTWASNTHLVTSSGAERPALQWLKQYAGGSSTPTPTPTATPTPTPTITPTPTPTSSGSLKVQYKAADTNAGDNQIKPHFRIVNGGSSAVNLSELTIRYWYTVDGDKAQTFNCDYATVGCSNLRGSLVKMGTAKSGADYYIEVTFTSGAGSIAVGGNSGEIQTRINKNDWTNYNETGDYSFDPTKTSFADWSKVTLYRNGTLVWGTEP